MRHIGQVAQTALLEDVARGAYQLEAFTAQDVAQTGRIAERYADLQIGLVDASIVVLAERHAVASVLMLDEWHFRALRPGPRRRFRLLPFDQ